MLHKKLFSPLAVRAHGLAEGTIVKLKADIEGTDALAGDIGMIRKEKLSRGRGSSTFIDFDDGVKVQLPDDAEVYAVISNDVGDDLANAGKQIGKGLKHLAKGMESLSNPPKKKPKPSKDSGDSTEMVH